MHFFVFNDLRLFLFIHGISKDSFGGGVRYCDANTGGNDDFLCNDCGYYDENGDRDFWAMFVKLMVVAIVMIKL